MIRITTFAGRKVAVFGLGASGCATALALIAGGADVSAWDDGAASREVARKAGVPIVDLADADWTRFSALVLAPGVSLTHPAPHWTVSRARAAEIEVIGDIELMLRERVATCPDAPVVAITGTNGKSTTTALITHILAGAGFDVQMGGNIGVPVLALEPFVAGGKRIYVIEMSSFQIDLTTDAALKPTIGVLLNISPDHLDRHGPADDFGLSMRNYIAIKRRLVANAEKAVIGIEDGLTHEDDVCERIFHVLAHRGPDADQKVKAFTRQRAQVDGMVFLANGHLRRFFVTDAGRGDEQVLARVEGARALRGAHNAENAAAALLVCEFLGVAPDLIQAGISSYPGLPHRMEEVGRAGKVLFINDSKATNADSTEKALASFESDIFWIVGGKAKEGGIQSLASYFPRIAKAYLIGASSDAFAATLEGQVVCEHCGTMDVALAHAASDAASAAGPEPVVLLSPACASYDQFRSFEHRGNDFRALVAVLPGVDARRKP